jgi:hypothetical protein
MRSLPLLFVLAISTPLAGCVVAAVAAGAAATYGVVKYTQNEAQQDFRASLDDTWHATIAALRSAGYSVADSAAHSATEGKIEVDDAVVHVERLPGDFTRVSVRIGTFETDESKRKAGLILEDLSKRLGETSSHG